MKKFGLTRVLVIALLTISMAVQADSWDFLKPYRGKKRDIITLVITSNYKNSRMMADLIQAENKQPYILLPATGQTKIFFCPRPGERSLEIQEADLPRFIKYINPQRILILGDNSYVPEKYRKLIDQNQTVISVKNQNWFEAAEQVEELLDLSNLSYDFKKLSDKLESGTLYKSTSYGTADQYTNSQLQTGTPDAAATMGDEGKRDPSENAATIDVK